MIRLIHWEFVISFTYSETTFHFFFANKLFSYSPYPMAELWDGKPDHTGGQFIMKCWISKTRNNTIDQHIGLSMHE